MNNDINIDELGINPNLEGKTLRDRMVEIYNLFVYWNNRHAKDIAERKNLEDQTAKLMDIKRNQRAKEAERLNLKSKIQESHIRDIWDTEMIALQDELCECRVRESITRAKSECAKYALDIGRTLISWDRTEVQNLHLNG